MGDEPDEVALGSFVLLLLVKVVEAEEACLALTFLSLEDGI